MLKIVVVYSIVLLNMYIQDLIFIAVFDIAYSEYSNEHLHLASLHTKSIIFPPEISTRKIMYVPVHESVLL